MLAVPENQNAGWVATLGGQRLVPLRVDGWRQGWVVPAGEGGLVRLDFTPQRSFLGGLAVGLLAALFVVAAAVLRGREASAPVLTNTRQRRGRTAVVLAATGVIVLGGFWGAVALAAAWLARRVLRTGEALLVLVGLALVAVSAWAPWPNGAASNHGATAQALALAMVALVVIPGRRTAHVKQQEHPAPGRAHDQSPGGPSAGADAPRGTS